MYTPLLFVALVGCVFGQGPLPFNLPDCDIQSLQQCVAPLMESGIMMRNPSMGLTTQNTPDLSTMCSMLDGLKTCVMPKLTKCGREINSVAVAVFKAVDYMCVERRSETEKYMKCFKNRGGEQAFLPCVNHLLEAQRSVQTSIMDNPGSFNLRSFMAKYCRILSSYEHCVERAAGSVCGEEAFVTKLFNIINSGLSFMNCTEFKTGGQFMESERPIKGSSGMENRQGHSMWFAGMAERSPFIQEMRCVMMKVQTCAAPRMSGLERVDWTNVDGMCRAFSGIRGCESHMGSSSCEVKANKVFRFMDHAYKYVCEKKKEEFRSSIGCLTRELPRIAPQCMQPMMSMESRWDIMQGFQNGEFSDDAKERICKMATQYESCFSDHIERSCGSKIAEIMEKLSAMYLDAAADLVGFSCPQEELTRSVLLVVLPVIGVIVLAIIAAVVIGIKRRHRQEKGELVRNDQLQQNLPLTKDISPEQSGDGLKV